jgi:hypothetical protein
MLSVRKHNDAVDQMMQLLAEPDAVEELIPLLDEPESAKWLAFQLLELKPQPPAAVVEHCLSIIQQMTKGDGPVALGASIWLREYESKHDQS